MTKLPDMSLNSSVRDDGGAMAELIDTAKDIEKVILIGVCTSESDDTEESLEELSELVNTAGAVTLTKVIQNRESVHPGTYIGTGKIEEVRELAEKTGATGVVCDDELSPAQLRNLESELMMKVMDRTMVILDIFAKRAVTSEGKIQVEAAQLKYSLARLVGLRSSLSRVGGNVAGSIGTRGPGEKKLELDRRLIKDRIVQLGRELEDIESHRSLARTQRMRSAVPVAAIVGYTNAGKSTLLNKLTQAGVLAEDKLFATLDPTTRGIELESGQNVLLTDTVGFIRKLPHHLIEAFKSTLEEARYADIIIHVVDSSSPQMDTQMHVVYTTLMELGAGDKPVITLFNKRDKCADSDLPKDFKAERTIYGSARTGEGLDELKNAIEDILRAQKIYIEKTYPYDSAGKIQLIRKYGQLLSEEYTEAGINIKAYVPTEIYDKI